MSQCTSHSERIASIENSLKTAHKRIDKVEETTKLLHEMNTNIRLLFEQIKSQNEEMRSIKTEVKDLNDKVDRLEEKPLLETKENVSKVKWLIISSVIGGIVGYIYSQLL